MSDDGGRAQATGVAEWRMGSRPGLVAIEVAGAGGAFTTIYTPALAAELLEDLDRADEARDWGLSFARTRDLPDVGPEPYGSGSAGWSIRVGAGVGGPRPVWLGLSRPGEPSPLVRLDGRFAEFVGMLRRTIGEAGRDGEGSCSTGD